MIMYFSEFLVSLCVFWTFVVSIHLKTHLIYLQSWSACLEALCGIG
jgi:hypothetical protein